MSSVQQQKLTTYTTYKVQSNQYSSSGTRMVPVESIDGERPGTSVKQYIPWQNLPQNPSAKMPKAATVAVLSMANLGDVTQLGPVLFLCHITQGSEGKYSHCRYHGHFHVGFSGKLCQ